MASRDVDVTFYPRLFERVFPAHAVIFDTDGVITATAVVHETAWRETFEELLEGGSGAGAPFTHEDYLEWVDGRTRVDGVTGFLRSRGIQLPLGTPGDAAGFDTANAVGNRKDVRFLELVAERGVDAYPGSVVFVEALRAVGVPTAVVSASRNCRLVLERAGVAGLFDVRVDGLDAARLGLAGKPRPDLFLEAARRLDVDPIWAAVVEDALPGVEAGRRGRFGLVIGVDRDGTGRALRDHGADVVVADLAFLGVDPLGAIEASAGLAPARAVPVPTNDVRSVRAGGAPRPPG